MHFGSYTITPVRNFRPRGVRLACYRVRSDCLEFDLLFIVRGRLINRLKVIVLICLWSPDIIAKSCEAF